MPFIAVLFLLAFASDLFGVLPSLPDTVHAIISLGFLAIFLCLLTVSLILVSYNLMNEGGHIYLRKLAFILNRRLYGLSYQNLTIKGTLKANGSMRPTRSMTVVAHQPGIDRLDHYMRTPEAPGRSGSEAEEPKEPKVTYASEGHQLRAETEYLSTDTVRFITIFDAQLVVNKPSTYTIEEDLPRGTFATTFDQLQTPTRIPDREFWAWDITRPTALFTMTIEFPKEMHPPEGQWEPYVWIGPSSVTHHGETNWCFDHQYLAHSWKDGILTLKLEVPYPILGLTYIVKWRPPDSRTSLGLNAGAPQPPTPE